MPTTLKHIVPILLLVAATARAATVADDLRAAQQLLLQNDYADATAAYKAILREHPKNVDALKGLATAEYWSGDFRGARRDFTAVLHARPSDAEARKAVGDIDAATAPVMTTDANITNDDQPMRRAVASASYTAFSDPLTKWTAAAGTYALAARALGFGRATAPFASITGSAAVPAQHLRPTASLRLFRFPDGHVQPLGGVSLAREWPHAALTLGIDRHEILYTATSLRSHPNETTTSLAWSRTTDAASSSAAVRDIRYFDRNRGVAAEGYELVRVAHGERSSISAGAAFSYRDTNETRFVNGVYDPYWTPKKLTDVRAILAAAIGVKTAAIHLHADAGVAHDAELLRSFHPWRASADVDLPLHGAFRATIGVERQATVFYRATTVHIGFSGRP
jgi:tetratricopeptide (TPR) repeat protein